MNDDKNVSPLMRQYYTIKKQYPDTILLFQVGDFYELFFEDAQNAATLLGIALTQRGTYNNEPIPLAGVPLHVIDHYISKLVRAGFKVALCDQLEPARPGKVVERGVTRVLTPGTLTDTALLHEKSASYLAVFFPTEINSIFLAVELLTGQILATMLDNVSVVSLDAELCRFMPDEILIPLNKAGLSSESFFKKQGYILSYISYEQELYQEALEWYTRQFSRHESSFEPLSNAFILLYSYLKKNNPQALLVLKQLSLYAPESYVMLDAATQRNLELLKNAHDGSQTNTLFSVLDEAVTSMGSRLLKKWIVRPLRNKEMIEQRLEAVNLFFQDHSFKVEVRQLLRVVGDSERVVGRIALRRAHVHDYTALVDSLSALPRLKQLLSEKKCTSVSVFVDKISDFQPLSTLLERALNLDLSKEWTIQKGFHKELDHLRDLVESGTGAVMALEKKEQERTGISTLKIRFNQVHGYGIEITNANVHLVPTEYVRVQTLANRERYSTQELKALELDLQRARSEIVHLEKSLFEEVKSQVEQYVPSLKKMSSALASVDGLASLAEVAYKHGYVRPTFNDEKRLTIIEGRHPVAEVRLQTDFIPNSLLLIPDASLWIITGPNMGGKSTFLRQAALIVLMAQIGSFVPAAHADFSLVDRIFTRLGASDNVAEGKSTFLVEMEETALICNLATSESLIILDEVGRGTSTFDGLAIAQAVVEYIARIRPFCLFATHYHELTALSDTFSNVRPYYVASAKTEEGIVLLHKIMPGVADGSFGLEVAAVAQLPASLIKRAREILSILMTAKHGQPLSHEHAILYQRINELEHLLIQQKKESLKGQTALAELAQLDCEQITAKQALELLWRLKELVG
ncbi:DNA mismatch repair protein MutS [Candidatus Dependentiae bacterium]|nr:DNA mismatch repair protein MutS [Candidatus Dependentiae bacterium]